MEKTICITGADHGLGYSLTERFLKAHYTVFAGKYLHDLHDLEQLYSTYQGKLYLVDLDVTDDLSVKEAGAFIAAHTDYLDILINNAGILGNIETSVFDELNFNGIMDVFNVNALGALRVSNCLVALLMKSETKLIVNISSEAGSISDCRRKSWFGYCMAKAALNMESCIIHNAIKNAGGQVLIVHPGWMKTYMHGYKNEKALYEAEESAIRLFAIISDHKSYKAEKAAFIDVLGEIHPW